MTERGEAARSRRPFSIGFQLLVVLPVLGWLAVDLSRRADLVLDDQFLFWLIAVIAVEAIPVPAWGGLQLSLGFPILIAVAIVYPPSVAALLALLGSVDPREFKRAISLLKALFNRCQMAAAILAGSAVFHALATAWSGWVRLVSVALVAAIVSYVINTMLVAILTAIDRDISVPRVLAKMHGAAPSEFLLSYLGMGLFGAVIARFYLVEGIWSVLVFLAPLVFARQMYFRSRSLADRLADQNALLEEQAARLEQLLATEQDTVSQLRELNRMKGEFVAVVSHELRTPVTALIGYAKTLRQPEFAEDPMMREEFLERMERQGDRLLRLVENLLTTSNLENNQLPFALGRVLFEDLCREVVEGLATEAERVQMSVPHDLPVLHTDRQLLSRVVSNLLDNALKYSPEGTSCELGARGDGDSIVFWVGDHGIGIPQEEVNRIFDRFYQVDSSATRTFRGAGLGLSLVQDLLHHLGGTIAVESRQGEGSKFTVTVPIRHPGANAYPNGGPPIGDVPEDLLASS